MTWLYVYCVIDALGERMSFGNIGFEGEEVYTIDHKQFAAVVSDSTETAMEYEPTEENSRRHKSVAEMVLCERTVLPVAFGNVFKNKKILLNTMNRVRRPMKKAMRTVDNRVELGVKVLAPKGVGGTSPDQDVAADVLGSLKRNAAETKKGRLFSKRLLLNASFLVDKDRTEAFSEAVGRLGRRYEPLNIQYSGPWPAYNFVDIHILGKRRGGFRR